MKKLLLVSFFASILLLSGCSNLPENTTKLNIRLDNKDYLLETAKNQEQREKGLMHRKFLADNYGMIFYFNKPDYLSFWMKNTYVPLQVIFLNGCTVVDIQEMKVENDPSSPAVSYRSKVLADKAIELKSKSVNNIVGSKINELCE